MALEDRRRRRQFVVANLGAGVFATAALLMTLLSTVKRGARVGVYEVNEQLAALDARVKRVEQTAELLDATLVDIRDIAAVEIGDYLMSTNRNIGSEDVALLARLDIIEARHDGVVDRLGAIEMSLMESPERALSIPLLRAELAGLEEQMRFHTAAAQSNIERVYDQNKWFIGLMGTMAIAILGLVAGNLSSSRSEK